MLFAAAAGDRVLHAGDGSAITVPQLASHLHLGDWARTVGIVGDERVVGVLEGDGDGVDVVQEHLYLWDGGVFARKRG